MIRSCVFCGGRPLTNEHIWADWMKQYLPASRLGLDIRQGPVGAETVRWTLASFDQTAKVVCGTCNSGWMSDLEASVSKLIGPAFTDPSAPLSMRERDRRVVTRWAVKQAVVVQSALMKGRKAAHVPPDHLSWLPRNDAPPPGTYLWAFLRNPITSDGRFDMAYATAFSMAARPSRGPMALEEPPPDPEASVSTFAIGQLGFQVFGQPRPRLGREHRLITEEQIAKLSELMIRIWPTTDPQHLWPPTVVYLPTFVNDLSTWGLPSSGSR